MFKYLSAFIKSFFPYSNCKIISLICLPFPIFSSILDVSSSISFLLIGIDDSLLSSSVFESSSGFVTSMPGKSSRYLINLFSSDESAQAYGVLPLSFFSLMLISSRLMRKLTMSKFPCSHATCKIVEPSLSLIVVIAPSEMID